MKKIIALIAALAVALLGFIIPQTTAFANGETCTTTTDWFEQDPGGDWKPTGESRVKTAGTPDSFTGWVNSGERIRTEENVSPPDPDGQSGENNSLNLVQIIPDGSVTDEIEPPVLGTHYSWNGGNRGVDNPPTVVPPHADWQVQGVGFDPHLQGGGDPATWYPVDPATSGLHVIGNSPVNASWFYYIPGKPAVTDTDYFWQRQVRTFTSGTEDVLEYEHSKTVCDDDETTEVTPAAPTFTDPCGTENDDWAWPESDQTEVKYELTTVDGVVGVLATDANPDDEFVIKADAQVFWPATWTDRECPVDNPDNPDNPDTPDNPETPVDIPTSVPAGVPSAESKCLGGALVTKSTDAKGNITTSTVNGHPDCAPENGEVFKEEGM